MKNDISKDSIWYLVYTVGSLICPFLSLIFGYIAYNILFETEHGDAFMLMAIFLWYPVALVIIAIMVVLVVTGFLCAFFAYSVDKDDIVSKLIYYGYIVIGIIAIIGFALLLIYGFLTGFGMQP